MASICLLLLHVRVLIYTLYIDNKKKNIHLLITPLSDVAQVQLRYAMRHNREYKILHLKPTLVQYLPTGKQ